MSHPEQLAFFAQVAAANADLMSGANVLEVGSYDVNGSIRKLFAGGSEYTGVDLAGGPGVDLVCFGHEVNKPDGHYDFTLSGECFEHDPHWKATLENMIRMTRPGGLVAFTCASRGRPEHGTRRTLITDSPGTQTEGLDYYQNLVAADFLTELRLDSIFESFRFWYVRTSFDLYFAGVLKGDPADGRARAALPSSESVEAIKAMMPVTHRLIRLPLRALIPITSESRYQSVALPYWLSLLKIQDRVASDRFRRSPVTDQPRVLSNCLDRIETNLAGSASSPPSASSAMP